jgi:hypothetical protein
MFSRIVLSALDSLVLQGTHVFIDLFTDTEQHVFSLFKTEITAGWQRCWGYAWSGAASSSSL